MDVGQVGFHNSKMVRFWKATSFLVLGLISDKFMWSFNLKVAGCIDNI